MDLKQFRYFLAVAEEGHFGRASERLNIVQSALSMQIRALEEELGAQLFTRTSRRVELSQAGALFFVEAQRTLAQAERARLVVERAALGEVGNLRIGFSGNAVLGGKISADLQVFRTRYPHVELDLQELAPAMQMEAVLSGRIDLGYLPAMGYRYPRGLDAHPIGAWPWLLAINRTHRLAAKPRLGTEDLLGETFVIYGASDPEAGHVSVIRKMLGCAPAAVRSGPTTLTVLAMVGAGLGVSLVPAAVGEVDMPNVAYRAVEGFDDVCHMVLISRADEATGPLRAYVDMAAAPAMA
ncbi:LysR substrate-binding domain-containing protein [Caulobacter sp. CCNWLY153]|uniref:LysR family transcriptional regulator n=1 Tax=Caulobacter radicis TaxID=2172650 RepID=A0A2T9IYU8_9CAUL|nr:LysR substrate-binding domain-containing protein [Caulobacter radicis]PVM72365.1 LysR family transcriptional regulator [Caulobacter radicis]